MSINQVALSDMSVGQGGGWAASTTLASIRGRLTHNCDARAP